MMYFSCKDCENRKVNCHSTCGIYKKEREEYDKLKAIADAKRKNEHYSKKEAIRNTLIRRELAKKHKY